MALYILLWGTSLKKGKKWLKHQADLGYSKKTLGRNPNNIARYLYAIYICIICIIIYMCVFCFGAAFPSTCKPSNLSKQCGAISGFLIKRQFSDLTLDTVF